MKRSVASVAFLLIVASLLPARPLLAEDAGQLLVQGHPLSYWIDRVETPLEGDALNETVTALVSVLDSENLNARVMADDALAVLGPKAAGAVPALLGQLDHAQPWVREAAQGALGAIGKPAVPALIELFGAQSGGPSVRAGFVLGAIGPDAAEAVPHIERVMENDTPVMQARYLGILADIDPARYGAAAVQGPKASFDAESLAQTQPAGGAAASNDWPGFRGGLRDGVCMETGLLQTWPEGGPALAWQIDGLGRGYSSLALVGDRCFTMGDLADAAGAELQYVLAYDLATRKERWRTPVGAPNADGGPRCTPTVDGGRIYAIGTEGDLVCMDAATGALRWKRSLVEDFGGAMMSGWKYSESPLVDGEKVVFTPGGPTALMAAVHRETGAELWRSPTPETGKQGVDGAAYSSAVVGECAGVRQYIQLYGRGAVGVDAETGRVLWSYNRIASTIANIPTPVVRGDYVFVTTAYNMGSALLKIVRTGDRFEAQEVYFLSGKEFQNHHGGVVLVGEHLYGGHAQNRGEPTCIDFGTGKILWQERAPARGSASVLYADNHLLFRYDRGEVVWVRATPDALHIDGRMQTIKGSGPAWAYPVIHDGMLYLRHADLLACYDIRAPRAGE